MNTQNYINEGKFRKVYFETAKEISNFITPELQEKIAIHNHWWSVQNTNFETYFNYSYFRYKHIVKHLELDKTILDIGWFFWVVDVTLAKLWFNVTITEKYEYYSDWFENLKNYIENSWVKILDMDCVSDADIKKEKQYDNVLCLALIEHLPNSPKILLNNIKDFLKKWWNWFIESPNIAYLPNRIKFLFWKTILPDITVIDKSKIPFIWHHHEYSQDELKNILNIYWFKNIILTFYNYSIKETFINRILSKLIFLTKNTKEVILVKFTK